MFQENTPTNDDSETEERCKSSSSSEGEYQVRTEFEIPNFSAISGWNPQPPASLQYMCLLPVPLSLAHMKYSNSEAEQTPFVGKAKVSVTHRQQRLRDFKLGKTTGRSILDEKKLQRAASNDEYETGNSENGCLSESVVELLEVGVDPCCHDSKHRTALHFAASQGNELIVKVLLDKGANPNMKDILGNTPMHLAAVTGHVPVVTLLLKAGTDIKAADRFGRTPLNLAKSRLRMLSDNKTYSSSQLKEEVKQVSEMMKTYLHLSGQPDDSAQVDQLCQQLEHTTTREEVDTVNSLLADFTNMTLQKDSEAG
ncbi:hypothetical protein BaRGS_00006764 [Batillaria attramentaria]|uniref:Ankyrin repeat domain-containing protein 54 n=1 Tax=Batillaria attramentaria TaxID=370345 RepID=A0ABD0LRQ3_9CAEN